MFCTMLATKHVHTAHSHVCRVYKVVKTNTLRQITALNNLTMFLVIFGLFLLGFAHFVSTTTKACSEKSLM